MNKETINYYLNLVPPEIRDAVTALHDDKHWAVYIALLENGETNFSAIKEQFDLQPTQTIRILRDLGEAGLVAQYTDDLREIKSRARSFYKVTPIGLDFIESLMDRFLPQTPQIDEYGVSSRISLIIPYNEYSSNSGQNLQDYNSTPAQPAITADASQPEEWDSLRYR